MNLPRSAVAALAIAAAAFSAAGAVGQPATQTASLRVIGIVEVPRFFEVSSPDGTLLQPRGGRIGLRARPEPQSPEVAALTAAESLETKEYRYEASGALVYGRERGWNLIRTKEGVAGWLSPAESGEFHSLEGLLEDGLTYLTEDWDGLLSTAPGGEGVRAPGDPDRRIAGHLRPVLPHVTVVLEPGQDVEEVRKKYRSLSVGSRRGRDGRTVLDVETGVVLPLFESPNVLGPTVTQMETNRADESLETTGGSPPQVLVFDAQPGWFQVALTNDANWRKATRAWLQASALWRYFPVKDEAEARDLANRAWGAEDWSVQVVGFQTVNGQLWANVELMTESPCSADQPPAVRTRGWVPAHAPSGEPTIWFYSRGC